jgi:glyoxylase-like metal-dependent hydrolase (beta-lactamase superfamily II)
MLVTPDGNLALQAGPEGALLVDTGRRGISEAVLAAIRQITTQPVRYIINTSAGPTAIGGNDAFGSLAGGATNRQGSGPTPAIIAHEAVLSRMSAAAAPAAGWPTEGYIERVRNIRFNGESIDIVHQPSAYSDADTIVYFRRSDVIVSGEIYSTRRFPLVDREHGGTVEGVLAGLNRMLDIAVPDIVVDSFAEGGTLVIPGGGRLSDEDDVTEYRDMVHIVRDRVADLVSKGRSLEQVKDARPLVDYEERFGIPAWTTSMFIDALYAELARSTTRGGR